MKVLIHLAAEDLIIYKAFADKSRDWADIEGILYRQRKVLVWAYIDEHLQALSELTASSEIPSRLQQLRFKSNQNGKT